MGCQKMIGCIWRQAWQPGRDTILNTTTTTNPDRTRSGVTQIVVSRLFIGRHWSRKYAGANDPLPRGWYDVTAQECIVGKCVSNTQDNITKCSLHSELKCYTNGLFFFFFHTPPVNLPFLQDLSSASASAPAMP
ncbi:hypothetical protein J3459_012510 [Metarhizium acridum]|uniref:uncharacterized protein n=1 Tax=Metarhizium acridum TaxID=92637 RepID=UPI001C6AD0E7|nr:hypothetical protein J3459_012510 [Metarhizium acridum]KAG8419621.1 hypothetical protein J3458_004477 [Metarhizium acridum]